MERKYRKLVLGIPVVLVLILASGSGNTVIGQSNNVDNKTVQAPIWVTCTPVEVAEFDIINNPSTGPDSRIHVMCKETYAWGRYFGLPPWKPALASGLIEMATEAMYRGKSMQVLYDPDDLTGPSFGCSRSNCRPLKGVLVRP